MSQRPILKGLGYFSRSHGQFLCPSVGPAVVHIPIIAILFELGKSTSCWFLFCKKKETGNATFWWSKALHFALQENFYSWKNVLQEQTISIKILLAALEDSCNGLGVCMLPTLDINIRTMSHFYLPLGTGDQKLI